MERSVRLSMIKRKKPLPVNYPNHLVYKTISGEIVVITILNGKLNVTGNDISPVDLKPIDTFSADSRSDYNWGIVNCVINNKIKSLLKECKRISMEGL